MPDKTPEYSEFDFYFEPPISGEDTRPTIPSKIVPSGPGRKTGGAENLNFTRAEAEKGFIEGEIIAEDFTTQVKSLIEGDDPVLTDEWLQRQARLVLHDFGHTKDELDRILKDGNQKFSNGEISESEWAKFAGVIFEEKGKLGEVGETKVPKTFLTEKEKPTKVEIVASVPRPAENTPEGWVRFVFDKIDDVEKTTEGMRAPEQVDALWSEIGKSLKTIPDKFG